MWNNIGEFKHGLRDRAGLQANKTMELREVHQSLHAFFENLKEEGVPFAMRVIREETGTTTRDENPGEMCLPSHMSKHRV